MSYIIGFLVLAVIVFFVLHYMRKQKEHKTYTRTKTKVVSTDSSRVVRSSSSDSGTDLATQYMIYSALNDHQSSNTSSSRSDDVENDTKFYGGGGGSSGGGGASSSWESSSSSSSSYSSDSSSSYSD